MSKDISRRDFGAALVGMLGFAGALEAQRKGTDITPVLSDTGKFGAIKDQLGKPFDAKTILGGRPYVIAYGFASCPLCNTNITPTIAEVQKQMRAAGLNVPIVVVTLKPEEDGKDNASAFGYQQRYQSKGVLPFQLKPNEKEPKLNPDAGPKELEQFQKKRSLHILFPKSNKASLDLHYAMNMTRVSSSENSHTVMLTLVGDDGKAVTSVMGNQGDPSRRAEAAEKLKNAAMEEMKKIRTP
jgi:cytochrome oxidase Cu insertion factor (SCO1/SenC/PrrC family)